MLRAAEDARPVRHGLTILLSHGETAGTQTPLLQLNFGVCSFDFCHLDFVSSLLSFLRLTAAREQEVLEERL
jgi:hypothetical protein